ncbi:RHS repeat domain-containing protein [Chryseobacterium limigenitum]|uniref:RHS repeat-associated core domain-containing protein n=1 Tax=Chryseobacterium limigenitum TaxID=1612149 RepID=A0A1K2IVX4_9FLAO|nr:RHS repeat-associated core domain-containing protein [Chryseobacterium limigenitum]SFZ95907.1 RHS repeat-associated core domain-containing protein [Chryseobacterium limigenitum]
MQVHIIYLKNYDESTGSYKFLHKDYIGSILAISDEAGNKLEQRHFDAWGNFTHLQIGNGAIITDKNIIDNTSLLVERGYTSHEHFAEVGIIHMNGRLYDPLLRRFLNADENIQDPTNTQNYNKYGYVLNNPLMYNDPNGEFLMWAVGALVGGYLNGVQANGSWNPAKWDWQRTWSAVLGGAIGGAAISGALGNIASNPGAIKSFLPGLVSGGLSSAFNGSNFLGGIIGGISYKSNLFDNKITSTNMIDAGYRYIISPDDMYGEEDIIIRNRKGHIMYRILSKKIYKDVTLDTDTEISNPMTINLSTYEKMGAHAVGFSLDYSATMGGGMNGGLAFVYFMGGGNAGSGYVYGYKGGNTGLEGSIGISKFYSKYEDTDKKNFNALGYAGKSSGHAFGVGVWGYSKSWGNRTNDGELWPNQKSKTTWVTVSNGIGHGASLGGKIFWSDYTLLKKLF